MLYRKIPASLQYMEKSHHIGAHIGVRIVYAVTHTGLRSKIDHHLGRIFLEQAEHIPLVTQIPLDKSIVLIFSQNSQPVLFQPDIIIFIHIIEANDPRSLL